MPFDPSLPINNVQVLAAVLRGQFNGLFDLIQAVPAGPPGADGINGTNGINGLDGNDGGPGPPGPSVAGSVVDAVNTLNPADPASVVTTFDGSNVHFTFGIPRGADGTPGAAGSNGNDGQNGNNGSNGMDGAPGASVANSVVDAVNSLTPGDPATVTTSFDGTFVHFTFGIPRGADGTPGSNGANGEVSNADLASAINGTSNNTNAVATMDTPFVNDPPTLADLELMRSKYNELVLAGRR